MMALLPLLAAGGLTFAAVTPVAIKTQGEIPQASVAINSH